MSYQREISTRNIRWINKLSNKNLTFTGCSQDLVSRGSVAGRWSAIHNAAEFNYYTLQPVLPDDAPLIFLGRIEKVKGCHTAIEVAKATNNRLIIAGNISPLQDELAYYKELVEPLIDGVQIQYIGAVNDVQKNEWLGKSKAMLFPIEWSEPFGIVMVEAMACGTPVVAFDRGSVTEVIEEGITGFKTDNFEDMCKAVNNLEQINRSICRETAIRNFDIAVIAAWYLAL